MVEPNKLDLILENTRKSLKNDPTITVHASTDTGIASFIPFTIPSGLPELDLHLGNRGGLPTGRLIEYYGFEACGKTTAGLHAIAETQRMGGLALFIDAEHTFSPSRAAECGVDLKALQVASVYSIEAVFTVAENWLTAVAVEKFTGPVMIVVDSVTGKTTETESDSDFSKDSRVGHEAKQIRRGVRRLTGLLGKTKATCILINHSIASNLTMAFGKKSQSAGGHSPKLMSTIRIMFQNLGTLGKASEKRLGQKIKLTIEKLKNAPLPYPIIEEVHLEDNGFNQGLSLLNAGIKTGWVSQSGKVYKFTEEAGVEAQFTKDEWEQVMDKHFEGYRGAYTAWVNFAHQRGFIKFWHEAW